MERRDDDDEESEFFINPDIHVHTLEMQRGRGVYFWELFHGSWKNIDGSSDTSQLMCFNYLLVQDR